MKATYGIKRANNQTLCLTLRHGNVNFTLEIIDIIYFSQYLYVIYFSYYTMLSCQNYLLMISKLLTNQHLKWY